MSKRNHISTFFLNLLMSLYIGTIYAQNIDLESLGKGKFKSYSTSTWANITHPKFVNQFKAYLNNPEITPIDDLNDVVNLSKVENIDVVKNAFKTLFSDPTRKTEIFNAIWDNQGLRNSLFDLSETATKTPTQQFDELISNTSSNLYLFIKSQ